MTNTESSEHLVLYANMYKYLDINNNNKSYRLTINIYTYIYINTIHPCLYLEELCCRINTLFSENRNTKKSITTIVIFAIDPHNCNSDLYFWIMATKRKIIYNTY